MKLPADRNEAIVLIVEAMRSTGTSTADRCAAFLARVEHQPGRPPVYGEHDRKLWWRLFVDGISIRQIALKFECSETAVRAELFRGERQRGHCSPKLTRPVIHHSDHQEHR